MPFDVTPKGSINVVRTPNWIHYYIQIGGMFDYFLVSRIFIPEEIIIIIAGDISSPFHLLRILSQLLPLRQAISSTAWMTVVQPSSMTQQTSKPIFGLRRRRTTCGFGSKVDGFAMRDWRPSQKTNNFWNWEVKPKESSRNISSKKRRRRRDS